MLTIIGRAAARRVAMPTITMTLPIRSVQQARTFSTSRIVFEAAEKVDEPTETEKVKKKKKKTEKVYGQKVKIGRPKKKKAPGRPKKGDVREPRVYHKMTPEEREASRQKVKAKKDRIKAKEKAQVAKDTKVLLKKQALLDAPQMAKSVGARPYLLFSRENRQPGDTMATLAQRWNALSAADKETLQQRANQEKDELRRHYHTWLESQPVEVIALANEARKALNAKKKKAGIKEKHNLFEDPRLPGRVINPFSFFVRDEIKGHPHEAITGLMSACGAKWKTMTDEQKHPYITIYEGEKEKTLRQREELDAKIKVLRESYKADPAVPEDAESA